MIDQMGGGLGHASCAASGAYTAALTGVGHQLLMGAVFATHTQKAKGQNAAFKEGIEFLFDELG